MAIALKPVLAPLQLRFTGSASTLRRQIPFVGAGTGAAELSFNQSGFILVSVFSSCHTVAAWYLAD